MYKKSNGKYGFKSLNIFGDLPGSLASSSGVAPGTISLPQQDAVYLYQLQLSNPYGLTDESLYVSKIVDVESFSRKVFLQLKKLQLVDAAGEVSTAGFERPNFGKDYTNSLSMIPVARQKDIVELLFWWDEETRRLKKLLAERKELVLMSSYAEDASQRENTRQLLDRIESKINVRPSQRIGKVERDEDLTDYAPQNKTQHATEKEPEDAPPAYSS